MKTQIEVKDLKVNLEHLIDMMKSSGVKAISKEPEEKTKEMLMKEDKKDPYETSFDGYVF